MTKREEQLKERIHDLEEMLVQAAVMAHEARERADRAEANEREATAQWQRLLENYASADARADAAEKRVKELEEALNEALEGWTDGANYKGDYLREKHGDIEEIARVRAVLEAKP